MTRFSVRTTAILLLLIALLAGMGACKKTDPVAKSRAQLITLNSWKLVQSETKTGTGAWVDNTATYAACEKDDNFLLNAVGTYEFNEGATKCAPADPQVYETGTWAFQTNETELKTIPAGGSPDIYTIEQLTETRLTLTSSFTSGGTTFYDRVTLGH